MRTISLLWDRLLGQSLFLSLTLTLHASRLFEHGLSWYSYERVSLHVSSMTRYPLAMLFVIIYWRFDLIGLGHVS
ncbi:hypothetical protein [Thermoflavimicrobium dichotomicum]|uniref:Uncharacterized protein n=1 Tax=Thermoflavimicrobium dichotomicum TaxID=46223 RepID=A0A1I3KC59_9BACL|nr:hypothetical protein [Thermoflavimicrobium dichotomicum]SFI69878.1 hypothetical protein SAMN05421852_101400 [Thermoflavimicrobium dichotomicum]